MTSRSDRDTAAHAHHAAVEAFVAAARAVPDDAWERPRTEDKWSPAQIAEHVRLTYALVAQQLAGGSGIRVRTPWWLRTVLRWRVLPRILSSGFLPKGARAPKEIRPNDGPYDREETLSALVVSASVAQAALEREWEDRAARMTHHVFGALRAPEAMRLATVHTSHHTRQLTSRSS